MGTATEHLWDIKDIRFNKARNIVAFDTATCKSKIALLEMTSFCGMTVTPQLASKEPNNVTGVVRGIDIPGTGAELVPNISSSKEIVEANRSGNSLSLTYVGAHFLSRFALPTLALLSTPQRLGLYDASSGAN